MFFTLGTIKFKIFMSIFKNNLETLANERLMKSSRKKVDLFLKRRP